MPVRGKFMRLKPALEAAAVEPFLCPLLRAFHEIARRRKIIRRHSERAERRHEANMDFVPELLEIPYDLPRDQQGDRVQGPGNRPFGRFLAQAISFGGSY
jgi:hypothetical protein